VRRSEQRQHWEDRLESFKQSGMTAKQWCQDQEISIHQFNYWKRKCLTTSSPSSTQWIPIQMQPKNESDALILRIKDVAIEVRDGFDPALLLLVVRTLTGQ
jgi:hypothetical protein